MRVLPGFPGMERQDRVWIRLSRGLRNQWRGIKMFRNRYRENGVAGSLSLCRRPDSFGRFGIM